MENINQLPNLQPIQPVEPIKNKNIFKYLFIVSTFVILGVIIGFYFILNNKITKLSEVKPDEVANQTVITPTAEPTVSQTSTLSSLDVNNNLYANPKFGFSLIVPKVFISDKENCKKVDDSYNNFIGNAPVTFFEDQDTFYFGGEYFYRLTGEQKMPSGNGGYYNSKFSGCQKEQVTINSIKDLSYTTVFKFYAANIKNDNELESYFQSKYGSGCKLGEKTLSDTPDIYNVKILGDGKDLGESNCPINFAVVTAYNPIKGKLVMFELGQDCSFNTESTPSRSCAALEIVKSLKFN